jgi:diacylglycerol kinase family enzyme
MTLLKLLYDTLKPERVIVAGGDGTIKSVIIGKCRCSFGIIPAGSANGGNRFKYS